MAAGGGSPGRDSDTFSRRPALAGGLALAGLALHAGLRALAHPQLAEQHAAHPGQHGPQQKEWVGVVEEGVQRQEHEGIGGQPKPGAQGADGGLLAGGRTAPERGGPPHGEHHHASGDGEDRDLAALEPEYRRDQARDQGEPHGDDQRGDGTVGHGRGVPAGALAHARAATLEGRP